MTKKLSRYWKLLPALSTGIGEAITIGLATGTTKDVLVCVLAFLGAAGVAIAPRNNYGA